MICDGLFPCKINTQDSSGFFKILCQRIIAENGFHTAFTSTLGQDWIYSFRLIVEDATLQDLDGVFNAKHWL
jgi:hypothetical protein